MPLGTGAMSPGDPYGLSGLVTANQTPPRPLGLTVPKTPSKATSAYLWKSQPESAARARHSERKKERAACKASMTRLTFHLCSFSRAMFVIVQTSGACL